MILSSALAVIRATHRSNLYLLKVSTFVGGATPISDIKSEVATDTTRLWHIYSLDATLEMKISVYGDKEARSKFPSIVDQEHHQGNS